MGEPLPRATTFMTDVFERRGVKKNKDIRRIRK
jgi:hypothetical protein